MNVTVTSKGTLTRETVVTTNTGALVTLTEWHLGAVPRQTDCGGYKRCRVVFTDAPQLAAQQGLCVVLGRTAQKTLQVWSYTHDWLVAKGGNDFNPRLTAKMAHRLVATALRDVGMDHDTNALLCDYLDLWGVAEDFKRP